MPNEIQTEGYTALVAEAEAAVASVKDPELRRVAFEKILETLLDQGSAGSPQEGTKLKKRQPRKMAARSGKKMTAPKGPKARVVELIDEGFFKQQRTIADVKAELANRGHHIALTSLSGPLQSLTQERRLRRQKTTGSRKDAKSTYVYSNW